MVRLFCVFFVSIICFLNAELVDHLKRNLGPRVAKSPIENIDYIYVINLDKRPEKYHKVITQLAPYGVVPHRFSAICGWDLNKEILDDVGVEFSPE